VLSSSACAQQTQKMNDSLYNPKAEVIIKGNKYKVWNNYFTAGAGYGSEFAHGRDIFMLGIDYHFHIKWNYFLLGLMISGKDFGDYDNYNFHGAYEKRLEGNFSNIAAWGGASVSSGYRYSGGTYDITKPYTYFGLFGGAQYIYKFKYDIGLGIGGYLDYNSYATIAGIRLDVFFSGAYKGKKK
jgi:hypothetical protein